MKTVWAGVAALSATAVASASPVPITFTNITGNNPFNAMSVVSVTVDSVGSTGAVFRFARSGAGSVAIGDVYIKDTLSKFASTSKTTTARAS